MVVGQLHERPRCDRRQEHRKWPVELVGVEDSLGLVLLHRCNQRLPRRHGRFNRLPMAEHEESAEGVPRVADGEDFVLGAARPDDVIGIDLDQRSRGNRLLVSVACRWRRVGGGHPVGEREGDVEVLSEDHRFEIVNRAVQVGVTGIPAAGRGWWGTFVVRLDMRLLFRGCWEES